MKSIYSPVTENNRIVLLDALRGFALFGILMVNMPVMFQPIVTIMTGAKEGLPLHGIISESFIRFFFEGKFYVIFSFLFGYGFWLFLNKQTPEGNGITGVYRRRLFFLMLFGLAHIALLWAGDILVFYAIFGFILLLFRKTPNRKTIKWAVAIALIPTILNGLVALLFSILKGNPEAKASLEAGTMERITALHNLVGSAINTYSTGSFAEMAAMRFNEYGVLLPGILFFYPVVLAMFLVGMWAARTRIIANYREHLPMFKKTLKWGLAIGLVANALMVISYRNADMNQQNIWSVVYSATHTFGGISLAMFYVSAFVLLFARGRIASLAGCLAPVGRMALTNYLMQSLITSALFLGWGLGWYNKIELWQGIVLTIAIFALQIPLSNWWLKHFRFGPFEWLWRSLTYLRLQKMSNK